MAQQNQRSEPFRGADLNKSNISTSIMDPANFHEFLSRSMFPGTCGKDIQDEDMLNMILDMTDEQNRKQEAEDKRNKQPLLPENPISYTSSNTKVWINHALIDIGVPDDQAAEIVSKLDSPSIPNITGASISRWSKEQWQDVVGLNGDVLQSKFNLWIDDYKKNNPNVSKPSPPLPTPTCTEQERLLLKERGMDENQLREFFTCPDELEHKYTVPKSEHFDQIVPSPTHQYVAFNPHLPYHNVHPSNPLPFETELNTYGYPPPYPGVGKVKLLDPVDSWIPRSPDSLGSTGENSDRESMIGAEMHPPHYHLHHRNPTGRLPDISIFQQSSVMQSDSYREESSMSMPVNMVKRKRGRPRKEKPPKPKNKQPILYKFILEHLEDPQGHEFVEWVRKSDGVFKFHSAKKDAFAKKWGECKAKGGSREPMTYQNMARALRNYTIGKNGKRNIMERVKKKLHYKFVPGVLSTMSTGVM